jgi:hypothetical protein
MSVPPDPELHRPALPCVEVYRQTNRALSVGKPIRVERPPDSVGERCEQERLLQEWQPSIPNPVPDDRIIRIAGHFAPWSGDWLSTRRFHRRDSIFRARFWEVTTVQAPLTSALHPIRSQAR